MKKLLKLVRNFINGIDVSDDIKENFFIAIDFTQSNNIGSLVVYGQNITRQMALDKGWKPVTRFSKNRYLYILGKSKVEHKKLIQMCKYKLQKKKEVNKNG